MGEKSRAKLLLARVGAGKTDAVQQRLLDLKRRQPLACVWVLLSTERQILDFRQRFMAHGSVFFNIDTFNFYSLYRRLLAHNPQRCLDETARAGLIRALLTERYRDGRGIFASIAETPGFVQIIGAFLYELKQNLILPEDFAAAARTDKEHELAQIYTGYQNLLRQHALVDREGEGWLALEAVNEQPERVRDVDLLIVDGYDQFNHLQTNLLAALGLGVGETLITLTTVPERETTIGRRFASALDQLQFAHFAANAPLELIDFDVLRLALPDDRHPILKHLSEQLLRPKPTRIASGAGVITLIEAPDPAREVGAILRRVKRLLLDGTAPDDILIAVRDWGRYGGQIAAQGQRYGLPLALHCGDPLAQNPAVVALFDLLGLSAGDFRRRDLLDVLRSPYFDVLAADEVDLLERISVEGRITGGREAWLDALELAAQQPVARAAEDGEDVISDPERAAALRGTLFDFFTGVTPPARGSIDDYVRWLEALIGADIPDPDFEPDDAEPVGYTLHMPERIRADAEPAIVARDLAAMQGVMRVLRGLLEAQALTASLGYARVIDWKTFLRDFKTAVDAVAVAVAVAGAVARGSGRDGCVLVTTVADARGLPHRHVFIPGLAEGVFPQPAPEDPLLLDSERDRLRNAGVALPTQAERASDDGLFYSLIGQARDSLTLTRPHTKNGETWAASHLWRAVQAVFTDLKPERIALGAVLTDPATPAEAALAAADQLNRGAAVDGVDPAYWSRIAHARAVEISRMSPQPCDHYSGRLRDPALVAWVADELGAGKVWSASQLNEYGLCGFRYFAGRLLRLEAFETPEDGMDSRQLGTLYHEILEATYRQLGGAITPDRLDEALAILDETASALMRSAPARLGFRPSARWEQEQAVLRRRLVKLIHADFSGINPLDKHFGGAPRTVYRQEAKFGADGGEVVVVLEDGERLPVRGSIDRMDRQGDRVIVIDYKTGSAKIPADEIERGRNFQMLVYLEAARALLDGDDAPDRPTEIAGGLFWKIGGDSLGVVTDDNAAALDAGKAHLRRYLDRARAGDFATHANRLADGKCANYCDFHRLCRMSITHRYKE